MLLTGYTAYDYMAKRNKILRNVSSTDVHHHLHIRKRISDKTFQRKLIDRLVFIAGPMIPVAIIPTAYSVWFGDAAAGIALSTWIILSCTSGVMALYALIHKDKALILTYIPLLILNVSVVVGAVING